MRPIVLLLLLSLAAPGALGVGAQSPEARSYLVGFHEWPGFAAGERFEGGRVVETDAALRFIVVETRDVAGFEPRARAHENVRYVEWNDPGFGSVLLVPNDARYNEAGHYGSRKIGAEAAWDRTLGSASVKVAVIDSGLRATHEEFAGQARILQGYDAISEDNTPQDTCGHGTHVTGTIAATINNGKGIAGMAQVSIYPIRALTNSLLLLCSGSTADLAQALRLAADQGAAMSSNSWGGGTSAAISDAISYSHAKGTIVIAAAGNDGSCTNCVSEPWRSNHEKVIVVSSTDANDALSGFSSQGPQVDVAAPGSSILSTYNSNDASYTTLSGTSMAAPHVTGTAALVKSLHPSWGYAEIDQRLKATAVDLGAPGKDDRFGHGRISADAATRSTSATAPAAPALSGSAGDASASLAWTTPADGGSAITGYRVYRDGALHATLGVTNAYAESGLANGQTYVYEVAAVNAVGEGARSNALSLTPQATPNVAPTACFSVSASGLAASVDGSCSSDSDGSVVGYAWDWGDGSLASSGASASHTYAASGTYTVTLTVADDDGATASTTQSVSVASDPDPGAQTLANGETVTRTSGSSGTDQHFKISVPAGRAQLQVVLDGPACGLLSCPADLDLYVRKGARATDTAYDCRPYEGDSDETCTHANPGADWWYVRVKVYSGGNAQYTVRATY
ncbi:MAG TPA: S8 family serine peptidase [Candidatus Thermoplasmatota archaeon]|nr:S8 family serine peptidase [Candidatus Thermoplasmatota archaeon]